MESSPTVVTPRLAVMGAGRWGVNVVRTLANLPEVDHLWVADPDPQARARALQASPLVEVCESIDLICDHVEAVAVCTPAADHFEHAAGLLSAGKHVLVEKPLAMNVDQAEYLADTAEAASATLMVGHQLLFHPVFCELVDLIAGGAIGRLKSIKAERTGSVDFKREPDVLWAYGPHDVAMILALVGEIPRSIAGSAVRSGADGKTLHCVDLELEFSCGVSAQAELRGVDHRRLRRLTVVGEFGTAIFDDSQPGGSLAVIGAANCGVDEIGLRPDAKRALEPLKASCSHFIRSVQLGTCPITGGRHGVEVTRTLAQGAACVVTRETAKKIGVVRRSRRERTA